MSYSADVSIKRKCFKESNLKTVVMLHYPDIIISQGDIQQSSANPMFSQSVISTCTHQNIYNIYISKLCAYLPYLKLCIWLFGSMYSISL